MVLLVFVISCYFVACEAEDTDKAVNFSLANTKHFGIFKFACNTFEWVVCLIC